MNLKNFRVQKTLQPGEYLISYQVQPKGKGYVITKNKFISGLDTVIKILKHIKASKNIKITKGHLATWLDAGCGLD